MGQKVHPIGFRLGIIRPWQARWYADATIRTLLQEDLRCGPIINKRHANAAIAQIDIERSANRVTVTIHTAKPGIIIGRSGANVEELRRCWRSRPARRFSQHPGGTQPRPRRCPGRAQHRRAVGAPRGLPPRHEADRPAHHAGGRQRRARGRGWPPGRGRDVAPRKGAPRPGAAANPARQRRFRPGRSAHNLWHDRRQGVDLSRAIVKPGKMVEADTRRRRAARAPRRESDDGPRRDRRPRRWTGSGTAGSQCRGLPPGLLQ